MESPKPCRTDEITTICATACSKTAAKCSPKEGLSQIGRNHANAIQKNPSGQNCSNYSKTGVGRSRRPQSTSTARNLNVELCARDYTKTVKKIITVNREPPSDKEHQTTCNEQQSKCLQGYTPSGTVAAKLSSARSSEMIYTSLSGGKRSDNEDLLTDTCANYFTSNGASNMPVVSDHLHAHQKPVVSKAVDVKDGAGDSAITTAPCEDDTCESDFTTSTLSKDWTARRISSDTLQQNCASCLPQDLPTELQLSSSPRSYKEFKEKCRDSPWRPTEMAESGAVHGLTICSGETFQDSSSKRRTGASCQALRHAVASLNRLDDFYMEKIGAGFFSEVYKVTHKVTSQVMVLKMNQLAANRPNMLKEVQLMNKLSHPNILRFMGVCVHEGQLHALTEYINGGSLEQLIMSRPTSLPHLVRMNLARDVARGMAYLHSRGLFHRDLTSKNVLIKKDECNNEMTAVVGDFGLAAKIPDPSTGYRLSTVGSPYWMSPECLKGQWYDHRSDVFSFGIVVCELIGRVPADPDVLPRSDNFGLDYLAVAEICAAADPPPAFLQLAFNCCTYEPKSRPTFPEIMTSLETMIAAYEEELKSNIGKRQSTVDPTLMSSMDEIAREGRTTKRRTAKLRSQSADARGCDNATPSDKARCHSARRVAELASRRDPHYRPMTANPFHALGGVKKILGDLFSSCLELPSLEDVRPNITDSTCSKFKPAQNDSIAKILDRKKPNSEPSSPTARKKWERKVATKVGVASLFAHPLFRDGWEPRRRGSCESGFWSCVGEDLSPEPPNRRHTSTLSSSAASSLFLLDDHRTSSIYTDSSEDIASLGGGDACWEDRLNGIGSSSKTISKIVEYFERKQAGRLGDHGDTAGPSRLTLLRASLEGPVPISSISAAQRLVVCEGAVRSKLALFDKK
ncbi:Dual specificity testis-specific protein kinase 2 [Trachymyrmex zeteki]|uniref:dual-specificity kinase n=2 Tax=Mycetomoellerius zeteki TaxID=64791 RepID=A0A151XA41_9HYME|nr:Dual specificity testis-specific protein kinase 2 [Trachymyrmex zeteki]